MFFIPCLKKSGVPQKYVERQFSNSLFLNDLTPNILAIETNENLVNMEDVEELPIYVLLVFDTLHKSLTTRGS